MSKQSRLQEKKRRYQEKQLKGKKFLKLDEYRSFYDKGTLVKYELTDESLPILEKDTDD